MRCRTSHRIINQNCRGHSPKRMPQTVLYLLNVVMKNRQASASNLAQGLSMETPEMVGRAVYHVNFYGQPPKKNQKNPCLPFGTKLKYDALLKYTKRGLNNIGTFFGQKRSGYICLAQMGFSMFAMNLVRTTTVNI